MEDFEYSVEISDRDWDCFFAECEECNLLPPSLAGLDDSGMSDMDDAGSILAKRAQRVDLTAGSSEADRPVDGPPHCEGSPVEHYLSKYGIGGMESVLSGSEDDTHLQSVNMFFERLRSLREAERPAEQSQVTVGKTREATQGEKQCSDGQQASRCTLPRNIPKLNSLPASGETAVGKETVRPVNTSRNINTMKKVEAEPNVSPEPAASNSVLKSDKSAKAEVFIREEACTETRVHEVTLQNQPHDSPDRVICSETTPHTHSVESCTALEDVKQNKLLLTHSKKCGTDLTGNLETVANVKWRENQTPNVSQPDAASTNKAASLQWSPSPSVKRKRRKRRRLSADPGESGSERRGSVKLSDSEEEQYTLRGGPGLCLSEDINSFYFNEPQKNPISLCAPYLAASNFPVNISAKEIKVIDYSHSVPPPDSQYQHLPETAVRERRCTETSSAENHATNNRSVTSQRKTEDNVMSPSHSSANVAINSQPCIELQVEEPAGLSKHCLLPDSVTAGGTGKSDKEREEDPQQSKKNQSVNVWENEKYQKGCTAEVISVSLLLSAESNAPSVESSQNDRQSAAKSVLAVEAGNSSRDQHTLCQSEAEPQQQLEIDCHNTDRYSSTLGNTQEFSLFATGGNTSDEPVRATAGPFLDEITNKVICTNLTSDCINPSSDKTCLSRRLSSLDVNNTAQQTEHPLEVFDVLSEKISKDDRAQLMRENQVSLSDHALGRHVSSCCTLDTESVTSLSNANITDMSTSFCSSVSEHESVGRGEEKDQVLAEHRKGDATSGSKCDVLEGAEDVITTFRAESKPAKPPNSVFAMSSFWSEMEKLTINDILGLRMSGAAPPGSLTPLQESEETDVFAMTDSGFFTQVDESKPEQTNQDSVSDSAESSLHSDLRSVMWESEPVPVSRCADIYQENIMLTSVPLTSPPLVSEMAQKLPRKIYKNVSVHNLHALDSEAFSRARKGETWQTSDEGKSERIKYFSEGCVPKQNKDRNSSPSSLTDSFSFSLTDIFHYLFGGKPSALSQSTTDNITTFYTGGNSVPETYDHFFSEFDTESFFCPLITAEDETKDKPVPIFSCSRSANKNLHFPEAYDYFFASSSSDESSVESDEEDNHGPVRVVTRYTRKASSAQLSTDVYENFFTDSDLRQNFFWKTTLSFRNINFTASTVQKQSSNSLSVVVPARQNARSFPKALPPLNALGNKDVMFPDPLLYHLEDRISRQLAQQPFRHEDLQMTVSNPRLDASFLPLKQSDMCLVCIAFASWVLKTANPQVEDAWKAVLLANVSALSAIRYLRKYIRVEAAASEKKAHHPALSES